VQEYTKRGHDFLFEVFNNPLHLEKITGLTQMANATVGIYRTEKVRESGRVRESEKKCGEREREREREEKEKET
jgi:hypothetical protein